MFNVLFVCLFLKTSPSIFQGTVPSSFIPSIFLPSKLKSPSCKIPAIWYLENSIQTVRHLEGPPGEQQRSPPQSSMENTSAPARGLDCPWGTGLQSLPRVLNFPLFSVLFQNFTTYSAPQTAASSHLGQMTKVEGSFRSLWEMTWKTGLLLCKTISKPTHVWVFKNTMEDV